MFWVLALKLAETVPRVGILKNLVICFIHHILTQLFYSSLKIVDDDIDWKQMVKEEEEVEDDEEEAPVVRTKLTTLKLFLLDLILLSSLTRFCNNEPYFLYYSWVKRA